MQMSLHKVKSGGKRTKIYPSTGDLRKLAWTKFLQPFHLFSEIINII